MTSAEGKLTGVVRSLLIIYPTVIILLVALVLRLASERVVQTDDDNSRRNSIHKSSDDPPAGTVSSNTPSQAVGAFPATDQPDPDQVHDPASSVKIDVELDKESLAKEIYDAWSRAAQGGSKKDALKLLSRLPELDPQTAPFFIRRFRESKDSATSRGDNIALSLALASGGPKVTELLQDYLSDRDSEPVQRKQILQALRSMSGWPFSMEQIPVDQQLADTAFLLTKSTNAFERGAGARILIGHDSASTRIVLRNIASSDPSMIVRAEAIHALGIVGDLESLILLETSVSDTLNTMATVEKKNIGHVTKVLDAAIEQLRIKYPK